MNALERMEALAERGHAGQVRKDGKTPYVEHPRSVVALLREWGVDDNATLMIAWGHDLLEDTAVTREEILAAAGRTHGPAVLAGIELLSRDKAAFPDKDAWLHFVAARGGERELLVKAADRLCNVRDFLAIGKTDKAARYLAAADPIFAALRRHPRHAAAVGRSLADVKRECKAATTQAPQGDGPTELYFVLDRSGSMAGLVRATIDGFNDALAKQRAAAQGELLVSTVLFDDVSEVLHNHVPVAQVAPLTEREYTVRGCTALLDALGGAIDHAASRQRHARPSRRAKTVVFVVITDGMENASRRYTADRVRAMVRKETDDYGWEFVFLGANIDAIATAAGLGIQADRAANFVADDRGARTHWKGISDAVAMCVAEPDVVRRRAKLSTGAWRRRIDEDFKTRGKKTK